MSGFSPRQVRALAGKLDREHVQSRNVEGRQVSYVEGWFAIAEANAIFGFSGWDRETVHFERVFERARGNTTTCGYLARIRVRVRAGTNVILREGTGWGAASATSPADAHERALKAAETDATKRALATFGNRFGLCLYDKEQQGVAGSKPADSHEWTLYDTAGAPFAEHLSCESFCSGFRQMVEKTTGGAELEALHKANAGEIARLRKDAPQLVTAKGVHYADIIEELIEARLTPREAPPSAPNATPSPPILLLPSRIAPGPRIDKSTLEIGTERRLRDKTHLRYVATKPCLVCGRQPCHAHHLTFAQQRGLAMKVSDEFVVPLCAVHHDELHRSGSERSWWHGRGTDPLSAAAELWDESRTTSDAATLATSAPVHR